MKATLQRVWPAAVLFAIGMGLVESSVYGMRSGIQVGVLALLTAPYLWWNRIARRQVDTVARGGVAGGFIGSSIQGVASLVTMMEFALHAGVSSDGWSPVGWAFALVIAAVSVVLGAIVGTACGAILVIIERRRSLGAE